MSSPMVVIDFKVKFFANIKIFGQSRSPRRFCDFGPNGLPLPGKFIEYDDPRKHQGIHRCEIKHA